MQPFPPRLKAFILPNVPHPKTTLVHMQKFNKVWHLIMLLFSVVVVVGVGGGGGVVVVVVSSLLYKDHDRIDNKMRCIEWITRADTGKGQRKST